MRADEVAALVRCSAVEADRRRPRLRPSPASSVVRSWSPSKLFYEGR